MMIVLSVLSNCPAVRGGLIGLAEISKLGRNDLNVIPNSNLTAQRYADKILRPHAVPYAKAIGDSFFLMLNNSRLHTTRHGENFLEVETIQYMVWPAYPPDVNTIENVRDTLGRHVIARPRPPVTVQDLEITLHSK
ncbi:DDE_3 domain-containing protein [Trichonephila clavipes]|nr:DDE_3 domain-containing protein [Trichonephila clavipes]